MVETIGDDGRDTKRTEEVDNSQSEGLEREEYGFGSLTAEEVSAKATELHERIKDDPEEAARLFDHLQRGIYDKDVQLINSLLGRQELGDWVDIEYYQDLIVDLMLRDERMFQYVNLDSSLIDKYLDRGGNEATVEYYLKQASLEVEEILIETGGGIRAATGAREGTHFPDRGTTADVIAAADDRVRYFVHYGLAG